MNSILERSDFAHGYQEGYNDAMAKRNNVDAHFKRFATKRGMRFWPNVDKEKFTEGYQAGQVDGDVLAERKYSYRCNDKTFESIRRYNLICQLLNIDDQHQRFVNREKMMSLAIADELFDAINVHYQQLMK